MRIRESALEADITLMREPAKLKIVNDARKR